MYIVDSLILNSRPTNGIIPHVLDKALARLFLLQGTHSLLTVKSTRQHFRNTLGDHLK